MLLLFFTFHSTIFLLTIYNAWIRIVSSLMAFSLFAFIIQWLYRLLQQQRCGLQLAAYYLITEQSNTFLLPGICPFDVPSRFFFCCKVLGLGRQPFFEPLFRNSSYKIGSVATNLDEIHPPRLTRGFRKNGMTGSFPLFFSEFQKYLVVFFLTRKSNEFRRNASSFSFRVQHVDCYLKMWGPRAAHVQFPGSMTCKLYLHGLHVAFPETLTCLPPLFSPRFGPQNQFLLCWPAALKRVFSKLPTQIPSENSPKRGKSCRSSP